jgi:hypothetical protein
MALAAFAGISYATVSLIAELRGPLSIYGSEQTPFAPGAAFVLRKVEKRG